MNHHHAPPSILSSRGIASLLRFPSPHRSFASPLLVVPSPIARWPHLDPQGGPSLLRSLSLAGFAVYCLDWGEPLTVDRDLTWNEVVARVAWARRQVIEQEGSESVALLGFSLGGTLAVISSALEPHGLAALVNLSGPIDFAQAGAFAWLSDPRWFDPAIPAALFRCTPPAVMRATLALHRMGPTRPWLDLFGPVLEATSEPMFGLAEAWAQHHVPLPPRAYETYVRELIQDNQLIRGHHHVEGRRVDLNDIDCPLLAIGARRDAICRHQSVTTLARCSGSLDATALVVPGGHLGSIVGRRAERTLHDPIVSWLSARMAPTPEVRGPAPSGGVQPPS